MSKSKPDPNAAPIDKATRSKNARAAVAERVARHHAGVEAQAAAAAPKTLKSKSDPGIAAAPVAPANPSI